VLSELDIDPWKKLIDRYAGNDPGGSAKQLLSGADFKVGKLTGFGQQFDQVNLQLDRKPSAWGLQFDSQQAKGTVNLSDAKGAPIAVNLQYVKLPAVDPTVQADENAPDPLADIDPKDIPALTSALISCSRGRT